MTDRFHPSNIAITPELERSPEFSAAKDLCEALNHGSWSPERFAKSICAAHRTVQQSLMRTIVATIRLMASDDYGYDTRNAASHDLAESITTSGLLDKTTLPFR